MIQALAIGLFVFVCVVVLLVFYVMIRPTKASLVSQVNKTPERIVSWTFDKIQGRHVELHRAQMWQRDPDGHSMLLRTGTGFSERGSLWFDLSGSTHMHEKLLAEEFRRQENLKKLPAKAAETEPSAPSKGPFR